jgi:hypothetical protein
MRTIDKQALLDSLHAEVDRHLQEATKVFQNLNSAVLLKQPTAGSWSAAQCLEHLNKYGQYYLPAIASALGQHEGLKSDDPFRSTWLGSYFTKMMSPETGKKKIKTFKEYIPQTDLDPHAVVAEFIRQQESLLAYVELARERNLTRRVPISLTRLITMKLGDVLQFVIAHDSRHLAQARRAVNPDPRR